MAIFKLQQISDWNTEYKSWFQFDILFQYYFCFMQMVTNTTI